MTRNLTATNESVTNDSRALVEEGAGRVLNALRNATSAGPKPQRNKAAKNLKREVLSRPDEPRITPVQQIMVLLRDAFEREKSEADLAAVPDAIRNEIHAWFLERDAETADFDTAHIAEEIAESEADVAEAIFQRDRSFPNLQRLEHAHRAHQITADAQIKAARASMGMLA